ncbi:hypothetical protein GCM10022600_04500 [Qipengyuania pelagi]
MPPRRIAAFADHLSAMDHHRADRHLASPSRLAREREGPCHRFGGRPSTHRGSALARPDLSGKRLTIRLSLAMRAAFRDTGVT